MATEAGAQRRLTVDRISAVLEEAVEGLMAFDAERLEQMEERLSLEVADGALFDAGGGDALRAVMATHRLLGTLLDNTRMNLSVLEGLRKRNGGGDERWAR